MPQRFHRGWTVLSVALLAWLATDRPWTVRPIGQLTTTSGPFDANAFVTGIWASRVLPQIDSAALRLETFRRGQVAGGAVGRPAAVRLEGVITSVDTSSRVGLALIDVLPVDGRPDAAIQIGPVLRGTALRDALDFIQFSDFTNQIEFAAVASALNRRVLVDVLHTFDGGALQGRTIRVVGAAAHPNRPDELPLIVPVSLTAEDPP